MVGEEEEAEEVEIPPIPKMGSDYWKVFVFKLSSF